MDNLLIPITYDLLLFLMVVILYFCGKEMAKTGKVFSKAGWIAIVTYTLNEGLRFGRGIDYNIYGKAYDNIVSGGTTYRDFVFESLIKWLYNFDIPFQGLIIIQSFVFIVSILLLLIRFREILAYALPFFVLFTLYPFENLIRWYIGFSFIIIGISQLIVDKPLYFWVASCAGCLFHIGLLPVPVIFFLIKYFNKIIVPPQISILTYILCGLFLKSDIMLRFVDYVNMLEFLSERMYSFSNNAEQFMTSGALGIRGAAFDNIFTILYLFIVVWYGNLFVKEKQNHIYTFTYNLFVVGFMVRPLANQIELLQRYDYLFYCFGSIISALVFVNIIKTKYKITLRYIVLSFILVFQLNYFRRPFFNPSYQFCYVWDKDKQSYDSMHSLWLTDMYNKLKGTN